MKRVLVFGTFDILHPGHKSFLGQARRLGDHLIAVLARDKIVKRIKGAFPWEREKERLKKIKESGLVDEAFLGSETDPYRIIKRLKPDVIFLGYDQKKFIDKLPENLKKMGLKTKIFRGKAYKPRKFHSRFLKRKCTKKRKF